MLPESLAPSCSPWSCVRADIHQSRSCVCPAASPGQSNQGVGEDFAPGGQEPLCAAKAAPEMRVNSLGAAAEELSSSGMWPWSFQSRQTPVLW